MATPTASRLLRKQLLQQPQSFSPPTSTPE